MMFDPYSAVFTTTISDSCVRTRAASAWQRPPAGHVVVPGQSRDVVLTCSQISSGTSSSSSARSPVPDAAAHFRTRVSVSARSVSFFDGVKSPSGSLPASSSSSLAAHA